MSIKQKMSFSFPTKLEMCLFENTLCTKKPFCDIQTGNIVILQKYIIFQLSVIAL